MTGDVISTDGWTKVWSNYQKKNHALRSPTFISASNGTSSAKFVRHAYQLLDVNNTAVLIHYLGDEKAATEYAHGYCTAAAGRAYVQTCPSVLRSLENECRSSTSVKAYRDHVWQIPPPSHLAVKQPHNTKQVKNMCSWSKDYPMMGFTTFMNWQ